MSYFYKEQTDLVKNEKIFKNNKSTNLDSVSVNRKPCSDIDLASNKLFNDSSGEGSFLRINKTLEIYFKVSVGNDVFNIIKNDQIQINDTTIIK